MFLLKLNRDLILLAGLLELLRQSKQIVFFDKMAITDNNVKVHEMVILTTANKYSLKYSSESINMRRDWPNINCCKLWCIYWAEAIRESNALNTRIYWIDEGYFKIHSNTIVYLREFPCYSRQALAKSVVAI